MLSAVCLLRVGNCRLDDGAWGDMHVVAVVLVIGAVRGTYVHLSDMTAKVTGEGLPEDDFGGDALQQEGSCLLI